MASAGFEPANLGIRGQHATSAPPKPRPFKLHVLLIYYITLMTLHDLMSYNAVMNTFRQPGRRGDFISYGGVYYLLALGKEIVLCHPSGS